MSNNNFIQFEYIYISTNYYSHSNFCIFHILEAFQLFHWILKRSKYFFMVKRLQIVSSILFESKFYEVRSNWFTNLTKILLLEELLLRFGFNSGQKFARITAEITSISFMEVAMKHPTLSVPIFLAISWSLRKLDVSGDFNSYYDFCHTMQHFQNYLLKT